MNGTAVGEGAKAAALKLAVVSAATKNSALQSMKRSLDSHRKKILDANKKDIQDAKRTKIGNSLIQRLELNDKKIDEMIAQLDDVMKLDDLIGKTLFSSELSSGLELFQISVPIGVIGIIFESRPDALVQISALCIKSGNAAILKGGSEAKHTNKLLFELIDNALTESNFPKNTIQLIETREDVQKILKLDRYIDLLIPRGSNRFVQFIKENTKIPVLGHAEGICHVYVDKDANLNKATAIAIDAKCQYPAACNAMETLLVHAGIAPSFF